MGSSGAVITGLTCTILLQLGEMVLFYFLHHKDNLCTFNTKKKIQNVCRSKYQPVLFC